MISPRVNNSFFLFVRSLPMSRSSVRLHFFRPQGLDREIHTLTLRPKTCKFKENVRRPNQKSLCSFFRNFFYPRMRANLDRERGELAANNLYAMNSYQDPDHSPNFPSLSSALSSSQFWVSNGGLARAQNAKCQFFMGNKLVDKQWGRGEMKKMAKV